MKILSSDITLLHGRTTGIAALPDEATDQPLLVFVHGGGATSRSFDIPGHSQILRAARNGFPAYALDRPGYGGSEPLGLPADSDTGVLRAAAERLDEAVTELWQRHATTAPGVVVIGCSIGGAVATHLAALWSDQERPGWPLLGLAVVDIGQLPPENVVDAWRSTPAEERIDMSELRGRITAPPLWTLAPHQFGLHSLPGILEPVVRAEGLEIVGGWPREWRHVASRITVPVHYRLGSSTHCGPPVLTSSPSSPTHCAPGRPLSTQPCSPVPHTASPTASSAASTASRSSASPSAAPPW